MITSNLKLRVDRFSDRKGGHLDRPSTQILSRITTRGNNMKTCTKCTQIKALSEFYLSKTHKGGRHSICKQCKREQSKAYRSAHPGKALQYKRNALQRNPEQYAAYYRRYQSKNRVVIARKRRIYRARTRHERAAQRKLQAAVIGGVMVRPTKCSACHKTKKILGHHPDYSKPLLVTWLCASCHVSLHKQNQEMPK